MISVKEYFQVEDDAQRLALRTAAHHEVVRPHSHEEGLAELLAAEAAILIGRDYPGAASVSFKLEDAACGTALI
jgi:hypothetical protein